MFLTRRFYMPACGVVVLLGSGYVWMPLFHVGQAALCLWLLAVVCDLVVLYLPGRGVTATRSCAGRFSNGDDNQVTIHLQSSYPIGLRVRVLDEIPAVFQRRDLQLDGRLAPRGECVLAYVLHPVRRGIYPFGQIRVFASTRLGLVMRRFSDGRPMNVKVYPSYLMLRHYELLAISNNLTELGIKRVRRVGHQTEFEHIREYVTGNDYRTINWKASARRHTLMVNVYRDERSQQVYNVIDKGRVMQQAFEGMTLLDYAINAALVLSYVAIRREDKAGLVTFADRFETMVAASRQSGQMQTLAEALYKEGTTFGETDYSALCVHFNKQVGKRSLVILYTNFSSLVEVRRQLACLQALARRHCLLVVFFEDNELREYAALPPVTTEDYYRRVIADKFVYEKRQIVSLLKQHGISALLTAPQNLSVDVINKYIELKAGNRL